MIVTRTDTLIGERDVGRAGFNKESGKEAPSVPRSGGSEWSLTHSEDYTPGDGSPTDAGVPTV